MPADFFNAEQQTSYSIWLGWLLQNKILFVGRNHTGAQGLVTNAVVLWNTIYMQAVLTHLRDEGEMINEEDEAWFPTPACHVNMPGHYTFTLAGQVTKG